MGVSEMLDIRLAENFRAPLVARSITEYWQRWHMSLGEFMEKYIYYPIVFNKHLMKFSKGIPNKYIQKVFSGVLASIVVFVIVGIWHGTGWNYVVYGAYQAFFVSTAVAFAPLYKRMKRALNINEQCISWNVFQVLRTFVILVFGRFFIRSENLTEAFYLFQKNFSECNINVLFDGTVLKFGLDYKNLYLMYVCIFLVIIVDVMHDRGIHFRNLLMKQDIVFRFVIYYLTIFGIIIFGIYGSGFTSASFIYQGF